MFPVRKMIGHIFLKVNICDYFYSEWLLNKFIEKQTMGLILMIVIAVVSFAVQWRFKSKFKQYSEMALGSGMSG
ncbi:MAG: hypothetical protein WC220_02045, partial [Pedobacter sp.]